MKSIANYTTGFNGERVRIKYNFKSGNIKTGNVIQQYITPANWEGIEAVDVIKSEAVCKDCPLIGGECYVKNKMSKMGLLSTSRTTNHIEAHELNQLKKFTGKFIRFGAFGEPVLAGVLATSGIALVARNWTGYTHQWMDTAYNWASKYFMASVHTVAEKVKANAMGFRTFRVGQSVDEMQADEVLCPASTEAGKRTTCDLCGLCKGASSKAKNVFIVQHG